MTRLIRWLLVLAWAAPAFAVDYTPRCDTMTDLAAANGTHCANQDITTTWNIVGATAFTLDGATANSNKVTVSVTDPTAGRTLTIPNADTAPGQAITCSAGQHVSAFSATTGAHTCSADTGGTPAWDVITNPGGNQALSMGNNTTTWTWGTATSSANVFTIKDTNGNSSATGYLVDIHSVGTSTIKPITITAQGTANGVEMTTAGLLQKLGSGGIKATQTAAGALSGTLVWGEIHTACSPNCTLSSTPRVSSGTTPTVQVVSNGLTLKAIASCSSEINRFSISGTTLTPCNTTANPDVEVSYEL